MNAEMRSFLADRHAALSSPLDKAKILAYYRKYGAEIEDVGENDTTF